MSIPQILLATAVCAVGVGIAAVGNWQGGLVVVLGVLLALHRPW